MKPSTKFLKMYYKLPEKSRHLIWDAYGNQPMTLNCVAMEVRYNTELGNGLLKAMGYDESSESIPKVKE